MHVPIGMTACIIIYILTYYYYENGDTFSLLAFGFIGSIFPDIDITFRLKHRHWLTHSSIVPMLSVIYLFIWNFDRYYDVFFFVLACGFHLISDIKFRGEKKGTYCIFKPVRKISKNDKTGKIRIAGDYMTVKNSERWLVINAAACFLSCFLLYIFSNSIYLQDMRRRLPALLL